MLLMFFLGFMGFKILSGLGSRALLSYPITRMVPMVGFFASQKNPPYSSSLNR